MHGRSANVSKKRAMMNEPKCRVPLRRSGLDSKESWKMRTAKYRVVKNLPPKVAPKILLATRL
jgi:hypothetical protein